MKYFHVCGSLLCEKSNKQFDSIANLSDDFLKQPVK